MSVYTILRPDAQLATLSRSRVTTRSLGHRSSSLSPRFISPALIDCQEFYNRNNNSNTNYCTQLALRCQLDQSDQ